jgi:hypothetical protein
MIFNAFIGYHIHFASSMDFQFSYEGLGIQLRAHHIFLTVFKQSPIFVFASIGLNVLLFAFDLKKKSKVYNLAVWYQMGFFWTF